MDAAGDVFGTTGLGGTNNTGIVYEIVPGSNTITTLASFSSDAVAGGDLTIDSNGNLFGTTQGGGANAGGTIFEIASGSSTLTTLATFNDNTGVFPSGALTIDSHGNLFGTAPSEGPNLGVGTVFELPVGSNTITVLGTFHGPNGSRPVGGVAFDLKRQFIWNDVVRRRGSTTSGRFTKNRQRDVVDHGNWPPSTRQPGPSRFPV